MKDNKHHLTLERQLEQVTEMVDLLKSKSLSKIKFDELFVEVETISRSLMQEFEKQNDEKSKLKLIELLKSFKLPVEA